ncbi:hypothetical protein TB2_034118 [Malus domestica]
MDRLPDWIITDFAAHWVVEIGKDGNTDDILPSPESLTSPPDLVTSQSTVAYREHEVVHTHAGLYRVNDSGISDAESHAKILSACRVYSIRSCYEFEGEYLEAYKNNSGKLVIPTGLLPPEIPAKGGNIRSFNLGGMGCSAGVIVVDLAKDLLQIHRNTYAVVVSTENITQNWYFGNKKSMLIPNCLFRVGGSAVLLSNKSVDRRRAKYKLVHVVRTHHGANDQVFRCVYQEQDDKGKTGVSLSKDLMAIADGALKTNITTLGPIVLPIGEQLLFFSSLAASQLCIIRLTAVKTTSRSWHSVLPSPPSSLQDRPQAEAGPGEVSQMTASSPKEIPPLLVSGLVDPTLSNMRSKRSSSCSSNPLPAPLISQTIVSLGVRSGFLSSLKLQQVGSKSRPPATAPVHHKSQRQRLISREDLAQQRRVRGRRRRRKRAPSNVTPGSPPSSSTPPFLLYR